MGYVNQYFVAGILILNLSIYKESEKLALLSMEITSVLNILFLCIISLQLSA